MEILKFIKNNPEVTYQLGVYQNQYLVIKDKQASEWEFFSHAKHDCIVTKPKSSYIIKHPEIVYQNPNETPDNYQITFCSEGNWLSPVSYGEYTDIIHCLENATYPPLHYGEFCGVCSVPGHGCFPIVKKRTEVKKKNVAYWETFNSDVDIGTFSEEYLKTCENHIYLIVHIKSHIYLQKQNYLPNRKRFSQNLRLTDNYEERTQFLQFFSKKTGLDETSVNELLLSFGKKPKKNIYNGFYFNPDLDELYPLEIMYLDDEIHNKRYVVSTGPCKFSHPVLDSLKPNIMDPWNQKDHILRILIFGGAVFHLEKVSITGKDCDTINDSIYEEKIQTPVYKICGKKQRVQDLTIQNQYKKLLSLISEAKNLTSEERIFLNFAATRFIKFDYKRIAEYYDGSENNMKKLMVESGLVIVDRNSSLEKGYFQMTRELEALASNNAKNGDDEENDE